VRSWLDVPTFATRRVARIEEIHLGGSLRKAERKRSDGRPGRRWEDNIKWILSICDWGMERINILKANVFFTYHQI
jgi:hypothetical protein